MTTNDLNSTIECKISFEKKDIPSWKNLEFPVTSYLQFLSAFHKIDRYKDPKGRAFENEKK